jgi:peptide subunit release factor 1 (eRF1)
MCSAVSQKNKNGQNNVISRKLPGDKREEKYLRLLRSLHKEKYDLFA